MSNRFTRERISVKTDVATTMSTNDFPAYDTDSLVVRPLSDLATLRLADRARDLRGWEVLGRDGDRIGTVADLLVNVDRLTADTLLVSLADVDRVGAMVVVPLHGLSREHGSTRRLVAGEGIAPIDLRYQSTTRYAGWVAIVVVILALAGWSFGLFE